MKTEPDKFELRYTVRFEFDGVVLSVENVKEETARDWLWEHIRGGTVQSSILRIRELTPKLFNVTQNSYESFQR